MYWVRFSPFLTLVSAIVLALTTLAAVPTCKLESTALQKLLQHWLGLFAAEQLIPGQLPLQLPVDLRYLRGQKLLEASLNPQTTFKLFLMWYSRQNKYKPSTSKSYSRPDGKNKNILNYQPNRQGL